MRLLKSLYGYCMSGKLFWEEHAIVLKNFGMTPCDAAPAFWYKHYPNNDGLLVLQYSDDLMYAATKQSLSDDFLGALSACFEHVLNPRADWYLQARITQDAEGNMLLDQHRYSRAVIQQYLLNMPTEPSKIVLNKYLDPLPTDFTWTRDDNSNNHPEMCLLEVEYGFKVSCGHWFVQLSGEHINKGYVCSAQVLQVHVHARTSSFQGIETPLVSYLVSSSWCFEVLL